MMSSVKFSEERARVREGRRTINDVKEGRGEGCGVASENPNAEALKRRTQWTRFRRRGGVEGDSGRYRPSGMHSIPAEWIEVDRGAQ